MSANEAAIVLGITIEGVKYLHRMRRLPGVMCGRSLKWRPCDIKKFVESLQPAGADVDVD